MTHKERFESYGRVGTTMSGSHQGAQLNHNNKAALELEQEYFARLPRLWPEINNMSIARARDMEFSTGAGEMRPPATFVQYPPKNPKIGRE